MPLVIALTAVTLTLTTLMAMLPVVLRDPAIRQPSSTPVHSKKADRWYVVRSPQGSWYLNGEPYSSSGLARRLVVVNKKPLSLVLMPANGRRVAQINQDLQWLRSHTDLPLTLGVMSSPEGS